MLPNVINFTAGGWTEHGTKPQRTWELWTTLEATGEPKTLVGVVGTVRARPLKAIARVRIPSGCSECPPTVDRPNIISGPIGTDERPTAQPLSPPVSECPIRAQCASDTHGDRDAIVPRARHRSPGASEQRATCCASIRRRCMSIMDDWHLSSYRDDVGCVNSAMLIRGFFSQGASCSAAIQMAKGRCVHRSINSAVALGSSSARRAGSARVRGGRAARAPVDDAGDALVDSAVCAARSLRHHFRPPQSPLPLVGQRGDVRQRVTRRWQLSRCELDMPTGPDHRGTSNAGH